MRIWARCVALVVALSAAGGGAPARADPLTDNLAERLLAAHNRERDAVGVPRLAWSAPLAAEARAWAEHLSRLGHLAHLADDPNDPVPEGENLWTGTRHRYSLEQMIGLWTAERTNFRPGRFAAGDASGNVDAIGHYTQMVWRATTRVGCAVAGNDEDEFLVCRYAEGGNVIGERPF